MFAECRQNLEFAEQNQAQTAAELADARYHIQDLLYPVLESGKLRMGQQIAVNNQMLVGWHSPVKEVVNPSFIELTGRNGLGWLEGFNELVTRCGYEWVGHPGKDTDGTLLTLHGLAANIPASKVVLSKIGRAHV